MRPLGLNSDPPKLISLQLISLPGPGPSWAGPLFARSCGDAAHSGGQTSEREIDRRITSGRTAPCARVDATSGEAGDRKSVVEGKSVSERVDLGGSSFIKKKN